MPCMKKIVCAVMMGIVCTLGAQAATKVASLHPMLSDMARQVGGDAVEVVNLFLRMANCMRLSPRRQM